MYDFLLFFICGAGLILMGIYALLENKKTNYNIYFFLTCLFAFLWIMFIYLMYFFEKSPSNALIMTRLANATPFIIIITLFYFLYSFPVTTLKIKKSYQVLSIVILSIFFFLTIFTPYIQESIIIVHGKIISEELGILFPFFSIITVISILSLIVFAFLKIKTLLGIEKTKLEIVTYSFAIIGLLASITNNILPQFEIVFFVKESIYFVLLFIFACFYSITKHRFFHLTYYTLNLLRNIIFIITALLLIIILYTIFQFISLESNDLLEIIIISGLSIFIFNKIYKHFPKFINQDLKILKKVIAEFRSKIYYCKTWENLVKYLEISFIKQLNIDKVKLYILRKQSKDVNLNTYKENNFTNALIKSKKNLISFNEVEYLNTSSHNKRFLYKEFEKLKCKIIIPLFAEYKLIGFLTLGDKNEQKYYRKEEINELKKIKHDLEIVVMNILLKHNLQEENDLMKEIIDKKTEKLRKQFQEIKSLLEQQADFIAVTAHEFRTPLSIALFQLEDTLYSHSHKPEVKKDMEIMNQSLKNLRNLTQKLFDIQKYDLNKVKLHKREININTFLKQIYNEFKMITKENNTTFEYNNNLKKDFILNIDKAQIRQVIINLLTNAIKFADKTNPQITLNLNKINKRIVIEIADNGTGITEKDKQRIFEKFQTVKASMGTGIGLGLYLCKRIIKMHKGKIWVENSELGGACFKIEL